MWEMALNSASIFFKGKLFADNKKAFGQIAVGAGATALLFLAARKLGLPAWSAALVAGFIGGGLQPFLFKNLKYR